MKIVLLKEQTFWTMIIIISIYDFSISIRYFDTGGMGLFSWKSCLQLIVSAYTIFCENAPNVAYIQLAVCVK